MPVEELVAPFGGHFFGGVLPEAGKVPRFFYL